MPTSRFEGQTGEQVLANLKAHLTKTSQTLRGHVGRLDLPAEYRRDVRTKAIADARAASQEAWEAFSAWSQRKAADARQTLAADETGTMAEETAKLRRETAINRLIQTARLKDEREGPKNIGGRIVRDSAARELAAEAQRLFLDTTDYDGALAHATAAYALGVDSAKATRDAAQRLIWERDPAKRQAMRDLEKVERAQAVFVRDNAGLLADAYQAAAEEARDQGDDPSVYLRAAVGPSMTAKAAALAVAEREGTGYEPPQGALASAPAAEPLKVLA